MKNQWEITTKRWGDDEMIWQMKWTNRSPSPISIRLKCSKNKRPGELRTATTKILEQRDDGARMSALANVMRGLNASTHSTLLSFFFLGSQRMIHCHKMYDYFTVHTNFLYEITISNSSLRNQVVETLRSRTPKMATSRDFFTSTRSSETGFWGPISRHCHRMRG